MKNLQTFMSEAWKKPKVFLQGSGGRAYTGYHYKGSHPIGWYSNKFNLAAGWGVFVLDSSDQKWLRDKKVKVKNLFRVSTDQTTSIVRLNMQKGTVAWMDNEYLMDTDKVRFKKASAFKQFVVINDSRSVKALGLKVDDIPSVAYAG